MKRVVLFFIVISLGAAGMGFASEQEPFYQSEEVRYKIASVGVQAAVLNFIYGRACEVTGICSFGPVRARFDHILTKVDRKNGYYVAHAAFVAGKDVFDIEYYIKEEAGTFIVMKEVLHTRNGKPVNEVIWQLEGPKER